MRSLILQNNKLVKVAAIATMFSLLLWSFGFQNAKGAGVTSFSDTLSDSDPSALSSHTFAFTLATAVTDDGANNEFIELTFPAAFTGLASIVFADINGTESGFDLVSACGAGTNEATLSTTATTIRFTVCAVGDTIAAGAKSFTVGDGAAGGKNDITNPGTAGTQEINLVSSSNGSTLDSGSTRVFIIDNISMTATVDTIFNFYINARTTAQATANGEAQDIGADSLNDVTTTATTIPWGEITSTSGTTGYAASHTLSVATNATNGFTVTLEQDQNMTSTAADDIDLFANGAATAVPVVWAGPTGTLAFGENGYGHYGITSEDATLAGGDDFGIALYAGNIASAREVFFNNGPADGTAGGGGTANDGATTIGYKIQLSGLQEAGDYSNTLTYIATPIF